MSNREFPRLDASGQQMIQFIQYICNEVGSRPGGSESEYKAGNIIYDEFKEFCDEVNQEEFTCHPQGFLDFIWLTAICYILGFISYFFISPILSAFLVFSSIVIYSLQQNFLYEVIDFIFPEETSYHVIGKIKPVQNPKKLILLSGHHDSAFEFPLLSKLGEKSAILIIFTIFCALLNIFLSLLKSILLFNVKGSFNSGDPLNFMRNVQELSVLTTIDLLQLVFFTIGSVVVIILALFLRSNKSVLGANDNLSAVAAILECGKYLSQYKPVQTEVWLVSFAGEEHMRGSKRFVSKHFEELNKRKALLLNLEHLSADEYLIATAEYMFLAKHSPQVYEKLEESAKKINLQFKSTPLLFPGSDAANFSRKGLYATTLFGLPKKGSPIYWHTLQDTPDKLNGASIAKAAEVVLQFVYDVDNMKS
ncbi:MAG: M28 family metallopeptidase [Candidatus Hodarchaeota archaeon]